MARTDHLGRKYPNTAELCAAWGVKVPTFRRRLQRGWSLEEALTGRPRKAVKGKRGKACTDPEGREFPSVAAMIDFWGVPRELYYDRRRRGWSLEEALNPELRGPGISTPCTDHEGRRFPSRADMCRHWGTTRAEYDKARRHGLTVEEALTGRKAQRG